MSFTFEPLEIPDVVLVRTTRHRDPRGWFAEQFRESAFHEAGIGVRFVQDNAVRSVGRVVRGMHFQLAPAPQGKLVSVLRGRVFDVAVDIRAHSETFGRWVARTLDDENGAALWIPAGFAHGYCVLSDGADVTYKVTAEFSPDLDRGFRWDDPDVGIEWPIPHPILSDRDAVLPALADVGPLFGGGGRE